MAVSAKRILFFPLSNVLGHLTRTFALAEELDAQGHEVYVALGSSYPNLARALPPSIRVVVTPEMDASWARSFGSIVCYEDSLEGDRKNLESASQMSKAELRRRAARLSEMVRRDTAIVEDVRPDVVITDYRFTVELMRQARPKHVFHISHLIGYPSLHRRLKNAHFFPLDRARLLVPGVRAMECWRYPSGFPLPGESLCGPFRWRGWKRLQKPWPPAPRSDVFLCFGSTGRAERILPWLLEAIPARYGVSGIAAGAACASASRPAHLVPHGDIESLLARAAVAFCHGGHGTVMECILQRTPMAIFPQNIEQLEIGRCMEALGLGVLVKQPYEQLESQQLGALIDRLSTDERMLLAHERHSALLRSQDGAKQAAAIVLSSLAAGAAAPHFSTAGTECSRG